MSPRDVYSGSCELSEKFSEHERHHSVKLSRCNSNTFSKNLHEISGTVVRVVDGDTLHIEYNQKTWAIRMLGIDTPELHYLGKSQPKWGLKARDQLRSKLKPGDPIRIVMEQVQCDRYGRILSHVFLKDRNINLELVQEGLAVNYCIQPNVQFCESYSEAVLSAQNRGIGIHSDPCFKVPYVWRKLITHESMARSVINLKTGERASPSDYESIPLHLRVFEASGGSH